MKVRTVATIALSALLVGCAADSNQFKPELYKLVNNNDPITVIRREGKLYFCPTVRIQGAKCDISGLTYRGRMHYGWLTPRLYVESIVDWPLNFLPYVTVVPGEGVLLQYVERSHIIPKEILIPFEDPK